MLVGVPSRVRSDSKDSRTSSQASQIELMRGEGGSRTSMLSVQAARSSMSASGLGIRGVSLDMEDIPAFEEEVIDLSLSICIYMYVCIYSLLIY